MGVSGQCHAPAPIGYEAGWAPEPVWTQRLEEKFFAPAGDRAPIVQPVIRHYTARVTAAPIHLYIYLLFLLLSHVMPGQYCSKQ
jgi:hypothetical protein